MDVLALVEFVLVLLLFVVVLGVTGVVVAGGGVFDVCCCFGWCFWLWC